MTSKPDESSSNQAIDEIADSFVKRLREGEHPSIKEYVERFPEHADEIRELFPTLAALEDMQPGQESNVSSSDLNHQFKPADSLGDYTIIREIGRGGMGIVFEAEHNTMRRRVALKVLPATASKHAANVQRFHREARAAGQLHHTNIVPVFEVGQYNDVNFYAMQFIHGQNLDLVIDELRLLESGGNQTMSGGRGYTHRESLGRSVAQTMLSGTLAATVISDQRPSENASEHGIAMRVHESPIRRAADGDVAGSADDQHHHVATQSLPRSGLTSLSNDTNSQLTTIGGENETYFKRIARVGLQVAEALNYAHSHGVIHRDIKPSNLILDVEGVVWVSDFGLAKEEGDNLTHTGDIVGTLRYMAPERFKRAADARSDIYSLGLTLYELCTLRYAFDQTDRAHLVKQITDQSPIPPRKLKAQTPRDLETIILKAIDRQPNRRYQTARELANDLRRFISDRPVAARRVTTTERVWRLCRRNPITASLCACIALLLIVGAVLLGQFAVRTAAYARELERLDRRNQAHLYRAHRETGKALRWSGRQGQNFASVAALTEAAQMLPDIGLPPEVYARHVRGLRNESVASMVLLDLKTTKSWSVDEESTSTVAFNSDLSQYAQSDQQGNIAIWQVDWNAEEDGMTGISVEQKKPIKTLPSPGEQAWIIRFSPDGQYLSAKYHHSQKPSEPVLCLWHISTGQRLLTLDKQISGHSQFTPDSKQFTVARTTGLLEFYSTENGSLDKTIELQDRQPFKWIFSENQTRMVLCGAEIGVPRVTTGLDEFALWQLGDEPSAIRTIQVSGRVADLTWNESRDQVAVACNDHQTYIWNSFLEKDTEPDITLIGHTALIRQIALRRRGDILLSTGWDGSTRMFDLTTRNQVLRIEGLRVAADNFDDSDMRIPFVGQSSEFGIWELPETRPVQSFNFGDRTAERHGCVFHPVLEHIIFYPTTDGLIVCNIGTGRYEIYRLGPLTQLEFTSDGRTLFMSGPNGLQQWELQWQAGDKNVDSFEMRLVETLIGQGTDRFDFSEEHQLLVVNAYRKPFAYILHLDAKQIMQTGNHSRLGAVVISRCGRFAFTHTWQGEGIRIWDTQDGRLIDSILPEVSTCSVAPHPDGEHIVVQAANDRWKINISSLEIVQHDPRDVGDGWSGQVRFSPDQRLMVCAFSRFSPQIIDAETGRSLVVLEPPHPVTVGGVNFSRSGRYFAIADQGEIQIWDIVQLRQNLRNAGIDWGSDELPTMLTGADETRSFTLVVHDQGNR